MPTLYLVRHGRAAASWDSDYDPGLDDVGREQARRAAAALAPFGPLNLVVSPMARTRETAAPLARAWKREPRIEPKVSEIPSPVKELQARGRWLREIAERNWRELDEPLQRWRAEMLRALIELEYDAVVVTHYIAINLTVGAAANDDRVVSFRPDYCSVTIVRTGGDKLHLVQLGVEAKTKIL